MGNSHTKYTVSNVDAKFKEYTKTYGEHNDIVKKSRSASNGTSPYPDFIISLSEVLEAKSLQEENCVGIGEATFQKYISKASETVGKRLFCFFLTKEGIYDEPENYKSRILSIEAFCRQTYVILNLLTDSQQLEYYIKVFANDKEEMTYNDFYELVSASYELAQVAQQSGSLPDKLLPAICKAVMHGKERLTCKYIFNWICQHCPRIVMWMHRYINHTLTVGYSTIPEDVPAGENDAITPILERASSSSCATIHPALIWLLSCSLPICFTKNSSVPTKVYEESSSNHRDPHKFIQRLMAADKPFHWIPLFNSDKDGLSVNRFQHHVFDYHGPTLLFVTTDDEFTFCVASDEEWRDSKHFYGGMDSMCLQLCPEYKIIEKGAKMLYFNISSRGFPTGLQVGLDNTNRALCIDLNFELVHYRKIPFKLQSLEVWGCGTTHAKDKQLEYKKLANKDVESRRKVNMTTDWKDNPDRYLLEMAGTRPNYGRFEKETQNHS